MPYPLVTANVYPNLATGSVNLVLVENANPPLKVVWYNAQGQAVQYHSLQEKHTRVDVSALPAGLYFLQIREQGRQVQTIKVLVD